LGNIVYTTMLQCYDR